MVREALLGSEVGGRKHHLKHCGLRCSIQQEGPSAPGCLPGRNSMWNSPWRMGKMPTASAFHQSSPQDVPKGTACVHLPAMHSGSRSSSRSPEPSSCPSLWGHTSWRGWKAAPISMLLSPGESHPSPRSCQSFPRRLRLLPANIAGSERGIQIRTVGRGLEDTSLWWTALSTFQISGNTGKSKMKIQKPQRDLMIQCFGSIFFSVTIRGGDRLLTLVQKPSFTGVTQAIPKPPNPCALAEDSGWWLMSLKEGTAGEQWRQGLKRAGNSVLRGQLSSCISHALLQDVQKKGKCVLVKKQWKRGGTWGEDVTGNRRQSRHTMEETPGSWVTGTHKIPASQNTHRSHESPSRAEALSDAPSPYFQGMDHHLYVCSEHLFRNIR